MKKIILVFLSFFLVLASQAEEVAPLCGTIKEVRKTKKSGAFNYTIVWKDQTIGNAILVVKEEGNLKKDIIITELSIKRALYPEETSTKDPFQAPNKKDSEGNEQRLELISQFYLDEKLSDRTIINIYLCSATISEIEAYYTKAVNQSEQDNPITRP